MAKRNIPNSSIQALLIFRKITGQKVLKSVLVITVVSGGSSVFGQASSFQAGATQDAQWINRSAAPRSVDRQGPTQATLGQPQSNIDSYQSKQSGKLQPDIRWIPAGQIPGSPWEKNQDSNSGNYSIGQVNEAGSNRTNNTIIQPARVANPAPQTPSSQIPTLELSGYSRPTHSRFIHQPSASSKSSETSQQRYEQLPYNGQELSDDVRFTRAEMGYPQQSVTTNSLPSTYPENGSTQGNGNRLEAMQPSQVSQPASRSQIESSQETPLEAQRYQPSETSQPRRASQSDRKVSQSSPRGVQGYVNSGRVAAFQVAPVGTTIHNHYATANTNTNGLFQTASNTSEQLNLDDRSQIKSGPASNYGSSGDRSIGEVGTYAISSPDYTNQAASNVNNQNSTQVVQSSTASSTNFDNRYRTATRVSDQLMQESHRQVSGSPLPVEAPEGWNSIERDLRNRLSQSQELLRRGAFLSAREEVLLGLRSLYRAIDLRSGQWESEPALDHALVALNEEYDFHASLRNPSYATSTSSIVAGHATQALKQTALDSVSPDLAAQQYRSYAKSQLVNASARHPWAADLLYTLGKSYESEAERSTENEAMLRSQAIVCYQAAMEVVPAHVENSRQLGQALLKLDRLDEAETMLQYASTIQPNAKVYEGIAEVHRRKGESQQMTIAQQNAQRFTSPEMVARQNIPEITELDPKEFALISPNQFSYAGQSVNSPSAVQQSSATATSGKSSWLGKLFR